ncbi:MAG: hypothetical protein Q8P18_01055 [Pseudomonadota bacterium]|nr:hypothetical protein [Pseudomonadota bacterium]
MVWLCLAAIASAEVVDGILHVVGERIVTRSDVAFEADFDHRDASPLAPLEDEGYPLEQRLVDFAILRELAGDIEIYKPQPAEVRARGERFRAGWPHPEDHVAFLARWGLDDQRLLGFLYSRLVVERYVARNAGQAAAVLDRDELTAGVYQAWMADLRARATVRSTR